MKISQNHQAERELMARIRSQKSGRSAGLHLSHLTGCLRKAKFFLDHPDEYVETDEMTLTFSMGKGFHNLFELKGETELNKYGIAYTPDEITEEWVTAGDLVGKVHRITDFKTVRTSSRKGPHELVTQIDQLGGYCAFEDTRFGRIHIVHLVGDYKNPKPIHRCYDFEFEQWELDLAKRELLRRRDMIEAAETMDDIPLSEHYESDWECKYCPLYGSLCPGGGGERLALFPNYEIQPGTYTSQD